MENHDCPTCGSAQAKKDSLKMGAIEYVKLVCGHIVQKQAFNFADLDEPFEDGTSLRSFQKDFGVNFLEKAGGRALLNFEMGLGKTIVMFGFFRAHPECTKVLWILKAGLIKQMEHEMITKLGIAHLPQIINNGEKLNPRVKHYIISYDTLWRLSDKRLDEIRGAVKSVVMDECQLIKDMSAKRTRGVHKFVKGIEYAFALSGTPIKNNASEYFSILHLLRPDKFMSYSGYMNRFVDAYLPAGSMHWKIGGIRRDKVHEFQAYTGDFIVRKTRAEVLPELPAVDRTFIYVDPDQSGGLTQQYDEAYDEFQERLLEKISQKSEEAYNTMFLLAMMTKLRHVVGLMKVRAALEYVSQFLLETDRKIIMFCHHKDVADILLTGINSYLEAGGYEKAEYIAPGFDGHAILDRLKNDPNRRVAVASQQHGGEGYNMQFLSDIIMVERQWNPANEEQCEKRISRIGQVAKSLQAPYLVAAGTIDDYFFEIVERKRHNLAITYGEETGNWNENSIMKELADKLLAMGKPKWRLAS